MIIREEVPDDIRFIREVNEQAFGRAEEARLVDLIRSREKSVVSLVAEKEDRVVGHVMFSVVTIDPPDPRWKALGLAPVAVLTDHQRQGIGKLLISNGLDKCGELGYEIVVVLGDPAYYPRFGFQRGKKFGLDNEYGEDEPFMVVELFPGALARFNGLVKYLPEFNEASC
jgi:putative acetyltransferase